MTKHTQGPWLTNHGRMRIVGKVNGIETTIAQVFDMPCIGGSNDLAAERGSDMEQANARLIAAAPDLLAALEFITREFEFNLPVTGRTHNETTALNMARSAIAKAKGE